MVRGLRGLLIGALLLVGVSCGDDPDAGDTSTYTPEQLEPALLTADDFGDDWNADMSGVFASREEGPPIFDPAAWCPNSLEEVDGLAELNDIAATTGVAAEISQTRKERRSFSGVSQQIWSNDQAGRFVEVLTAAFDFCDGQSWKPGTDDADELSVENLGSIDLGDRSVSGVTVAVTPGPDGQYIWKSRVVVVQIGSVVMTLRELDVQAEGSDPFYSDEMWDDLVAKALDKVRAVTG